MNRELQLRDALSVARNLACGIGDENSRKFLYLLIASLGALLDEWESEDAAAVEWPECGDVEVRR